MFFYETLSCVSDRQSIEDTQDTHCDGYISLGIVSLCGWFSLCTSYGCVFQPLSQRVVFYQLTNTLEYYLSIIGFKSRQ